MGVGMAPARCPAPKKTNFESDVYLADSPLNGVPWYTFFLFEVYGVLVSFSTRGVQKHHKKMLGEVHVKKIGQKS
jgi:hypothetical protein